MNNYPSVESKIPDLAHKGISPKFFPNFDDQEVINQLDAIRNELAGEYNNINNLVHQSSHYHYKNGLLFAINLLARKIEGLKNDNIQS